MALPGNGWEDEAPVDPDGIILRIDLRDFLWDATLWNRLIEEYPDLRVVFRELPILGPDSVTAARLSLAPGLVVSLLQETHADQSEGRLGMELMRIRALFETLPPGAMVILDELCSGTNPSEGEEIFGLAGQTIHYRKPRPKKENTTQRLQRDRESKVWGEVIDAVGRPAEGVEWVHVLDRGADNFEVYRHCLEQEADWVVRVTQKQRNILTPDDERMPLAAYLDTLPLSGTYELLLRARPGQAARTAKLQVRHGALLVPAPAHQSPYVNRIHPGPIEMHVVEVREVNPPAGVKPIEWILLTSLVVEGFEDAWVVIGYYEKRWLIEEWHKALKTGCRVTERQLKAKHRLEAMVGLLSVVSVRLLQLKSAARVEPDRPARRMIPPRWIALLQAARKNVKHTKSLTVGEFYHELAKLGGFIGRKSDGEPGWITIWRGWQKLHLMVRGVQLADMLR